MRYADRFLLFIEAHKAANIVNVELEFKYRRHLGDLTGKVRPLLDVSLINYHNGNQRMMEALVDPGSTITVFPTDMAAILGLKLRWTQQNMRWAGKTFPLGYAEMDVAVFEKRI